MGRWVLLFLSIAGLVVLIAGCDSGGNPAIVASTPTPQPFPTFAAPPAVISSSTMQPDVTLSPAEVASLFPVRVLDRSIVRGGDRFGAAPGTPVPDILFNLEFVNNTGHEIHNFVGVVSFTHKSGTVLAALRFAYKDAIPTPAPVMPGGLIRGPVYAHDSPYIETNKVLDSAPLSDISVAFRVQYINYPVGPQQVIHITSGAPGPALAALRWLARPGS